MKRKTLGILASMAVVPCAVIMASCGGSQLDQRAEFDKSGNYEASSMSAISEYIAGEGVTNEITTKGYHFTMDMVTGDEYTKLNGYVKLDEDGKPTEFAISAKAKTTYLEETMETDMKIWAKDGYLYTDTVYGGVSAKLKTAYENIADELGDYDSFYSSTEQYLSMLTMFVGKAEGATDKLEYKVASTDTTFKAQIKLKETLEVEMYGSTQKYENLEFNVSFANNALVGCSLEYKGTATMAGETEEGSAYMAITQFDGEIQYPNLNDFKEFSF